MAPDQTAPHSSSITEVGTTSTRVPGAATRSGSARPLQREPLQRLELFRGEARLLPIAGNVKRIAIGNGTMLSATSVEDGILLLGEQPGISSLIVWTDQRVSHFHVSVFDQDIEQTQRYLETIVADHPNARVERMGGRLVLRGTVYRPAMQQISALVGQMPGVVNLLHEDDGFARKKTVHFKVQIVELSKTVAENLGISWDKAFAGPRIDLQSTGRSTGIYNQLPAPLNGDQLFQAGRTPVQIGSALGGTYIGIATNIMSTINLAINNGDATVLAAPEVSTASGGEAKFLAGGEVPIVTSSFGGTSVEYKQYGIILNIKPLVDSNDNISAAIETEVSQIDPSVTYGGFPAFLTRKSSSDVSLHPYETLAISGLVNSNWARAVDKVPFLGDLPVLGRLFRSDNFQNKRTDLVIFVTPDVQSTTMGDENRALIQKARDIGGRIPAVETDRRLTPGTPASTDRSPLPPNDSPPPPTTLPATIPPPIPGGPGSPNFFDRPETQP